MPVNWKWTGPVIEKLLAVVVRAFHDHQNIPPHNPKCKCSGPDHQDHEKVCGGAVLEKSGVNVCFLAASSLLSLRIVIIITIIRIITISTMITMITIITMITLITLITMVRITAHCNHHLLSLHSVVIIVTMIEI